MIVFVSSDAPVDRGRLTDVLERGADHGVHAVFVSPKGKAEGAALSLDGSEGNYYDARTLAWSPDSTRFVFGTYEGSALVAVTPAP